MWAARRTIGVEFKFGVRVVIIGNGQSTRRGQGRSECDGQAPAPHPSQCELHAYCLMTNHVHLLLTPQDSEACSLLMRDLGRSYVQYFNRRHDRTGTLWEGRFRSCIVESAGYVLACYRYVELNPVRAGMVNHPSSYAWSSHAVNAGMRADPAVLPHCEFTALALCSNPYATPRTAVIPSSAMASSRG